MTDEKIIAVARQYRDLLLRSYPMAVSRRISAPESRIVNSHSIEIVNHLLHVCHSIPAFVQAGRREKAMRWLGFLQGVLWMKGFRSLDELGADNKPDNEEFEPTRG